MKMTIAKRMSMGFALVTIVTMGLGVFTYMKLRSIEGNVDSVIEDTVPSLQAVLTVQATQRLNALNLTMHILADEPQELARIDALIKKRTAEISTELDQFEKMISSDEERRLYAEVKHVRSEFAQVRDRILLLSNEGKNSEATKLFAEQGKPALDQFDKAIGALVEFNERMTAQQSEQLNATLSAGRTGVLVGVSLTIMMAIVVAFVTIRAINTALKKIAEMLNTGSEQVASASSQVSSSSQSLAQGASEQAASLEETSSALEEMSSMTKKNAESAQQAAGLAGEAKGAADKGNTEMARMGKAIAEIEKSASETAKIIKVIDEIAFQTNLLALNAAVEAARAGEAGKGFAVVAEEVRNLAMRSADAAKNTAAMIEESVKNAKNGVQIANEVGKTLSDITASNQKVNALISEIAAASAEQAQGIGQVNTAVTQMDKVTQSNAAAAEESASASEELSSQAMELNGIVSTLMQLVTGAEISTDKKDFRRAITKPVTRIAPKAPVASVVKPSQVLPLGDADGSKDGFADFSEAA